VDGQIGLEATPQEWVDKMVLVSRGVWRVLRDDGTFWINVGDSYASQGGSRTSCTETLTGQGARREAEEDRSRSCVDGLKAKDLCLMPFRLALALQEAGWYVRSDICWAKKSPMPESVTDRPTSAWEHVFLLSKQAKYYYDAEAVRQPPEMTEASLKRTQYPRYRNSNKRDDDNGKPDFITDPEKGGWPSIANLRNVWRLGPEPYPEAHFATFPSEIPRRAILAGTSEKGCCSACGAPWVRVVEDQGYAKHRPSAGNDPRSRSEDKQALGSMGGHHGWQGNNLLKIPPKTTGWRAGCDCEASVVPATVIDPFMGSGTTAAVAQNLRRRWIGIELNAEYCDLAVRRIQTQAAQMRLAI
tara:strand:+ start:4140 stop:5210 length:1071 start_codon:yes stop_codon:yes gene_type:complete